jgi:hypothetical protein
VEAPAERIFVVIETFCRINGGSRLQASDYDRSPAGETCNATPSINATERSIRFSSCLTLPGQSEFVSQLVVSAEILSTGLFIRRANFCLK